jgi:hypothetical protein
VLPAQRSHVGASREAWRSWRRLGAAAVAVVAIAAAAAVVLAARTARGPSHVFLIVLENRGYEEVIGNPAAPYLNQLAGDYALADAYFALAHPSLPNYLGLIAGQTLGVEDDCTDCFFDAPTLADQLEAVGRTWRSYQEDLPKPCFLGEASAGYVLRHNPFLYFRAVRDDPARCTAVVPLTQLDADLASNQVPDLAFITPNVRHDMHDGSTAEGDQWLAAFVPKLLASSAWRDGGVLIVTWDEGSTDQGCCGQPGGGHIAMIVASAAGPRGYRSSTAANHYGLLRTLEDQWGLGRLGHAADPSTAGLNDLFPR